jgi:hypothetical protein
MHQYISYEDCKFFFPFACFENSCFMNKCLKKITTKVKSSDYRLVKIFNAYNTPEVPFFH